MGFLRWRLDESLSRPVGAILAPSQLRNICDRTDVGPGAQSPVDIKKVKGLHSGGPQEPSRPATAVHGSWERAVTWACRLVPVAVAVLGWADLVDLDASVAASWRMARSVPALHWSMAEANVAAVSFAVWITWFEVLDGLPRLQRFRFVPRPAPRKDTGEGQSRGLKHGRRVLLSFPVYLGAIFLLHMWRLPKVAQVEPPSAIRLVAELLLGLWAYDFIFYWIHLAMHMLPLFPHGHGVHHQFPARAGDVAEHLEADSVVHHSLLDGALQVGTNILVQNMPLYFGLPKHKMCRFLHNIVVTYLLTESHAGLDLPWASHRLLPGLVGGALRHEVHHRRRSCCFHQFFCYLDDALGYGPPDEEEQGAACQSQALMPAGPLARPTARLRAGWAQGGR